MVEGETRAPTGSRSTWRAAFDRAVALLLGAVTIGNALVAVLSAAVNSPSARVVAVVLLVAANVGALLAATRPVAVRRRRAVAVPLALTLLTVAGLVLATVAAVEAGVPVSGWWPFGLASITAVLLAVGSRHGPVLAVVLLATYATCRAQVPTGGDGPGEAALVEGVSFANALLTITVMVLVIRRGADRADAAATRLREAEHELAAQRAAERAHDDIDRWIHDEVMHALRAVQLAGRGLAAAEVRHVLGALSWERVDAAERDARGVDLREVLPDRWDALDLAAEGVPVVVPGRVADALRGAVGEALRNVVRHAGVTRARLTVRADGAGGVVVEVADAGRGLRGAAPGRGIRESIRGRLAEVGGAAELLPGPGGGTVVRLAWRPATATAAATAAADARTAASGADGSPDEPRLETILGWLRTGFVLAGAPSLVASAVFVAALQDEMARPLLNLASFALLLLTAGLATWWLLRGRYGAGALSVTLLAAAAVAVGNAAAMPRPADNGFLYWAAGGVLPLLIVVMVFGRWPGAVVGGAGLVVVVAGGAVASTSGGDLGPMLPAVLTPVNAFVPALLGRLAIDRLARSLEVDMEATRAAERLRGESVARSATAEQRLRELAPVRDFLARASRHVTDHVTDPTDDGLRREAAILEAAIRDRLDAGRVPHPDLAAAAARLREHGWWVSVRWGAAEDDTALAALLDRLAEALAGHPAPPDGRVTVSVRAANGGAGGTATAVLIPGADGSWTPPDELARLTGPQGPLTVTASP